MVEPKMTSSITSHDLETWPQYL